MGRFVRSIELSALAGETNGFMPRQLLIRDGMVDLLASDGSGIITLGRNLQVLKRTDFSGGHPGRILWIAADPAGGWVGIAREPGGDAPEAVKAVRVMADGRVETLVSMGESRNVDPAAIVPLEDGGYLISDRAGDRLAVLGTDGIERSFGESGSWDGALWLPGEAYRFPDGGVVVVDQGNHRAQVFDPKTGEWSLTFSLGMGHDKPMFLKEDFIEDREETR